MRVKKIIAALSVIASVPAVPAIAAAAPHPPAACAQADGGGTGTFYHG